MPVPELDASTMDAALAVALRAARAAGGIIDECISRRVSGAAVDTKETAVDLVTEYDRACEDIIMSMLRAHQPTWAVLGEESHEEEAIGEGPTWIVDPIDGTTSFVHGGFDCGVSIGLAVNRVPVLGVVYLPRMKEMFRAIAGRGAFLNDDAISVSKVRTLDKAVVCTHVPYKRTPEAIAVVSGINGSLIPRVAAMRSYGSCAMDMCSVACGRLDLYFESNIHAWDICAATVIVREAGGVVHDLFDAKAPFFDICGKNQACGSCLALTQVAVDLNRQFGYHKIISGKDQV